jgi:mannose-1-phosphate guanylyltransferase
LDFIKESSKEKRNINLSFDILEKLPKQEKLYAYDIKNTGWMDVESPAKVTRNTKIVEDILKKMDLNSSSEEHPSIK